MFLEIGDLIVNKSFEEPIFREITEVRKTGYSWIYPDVPNIVFYSEDSSDPFFEWKWEVVKGNTQKREVGYE